MLYKKSHVLSAINVPDEYIGGTIRTTFGIDNTKEEVDYLINSICEILNKIDVPVDIIGEVKGAVLKLGDNEFTIDELNDSYHGVIEKYMA